MRNAEPLQHSQLVGSAQVEPEGGDWLLQGLLDVRLCWFVSERCEGLDTRVVLEGGSMLKDVWNELPQADP